MNRKPVVFKLRKVLPTGLVFPFDFGFIPKTKCEDGDLLDVVVISQIQIFPVVVWIAANQTEEEGETMRNDRFLVVPEVSEQFKEVPELDDLPKGMVAGRKFL